MSRSSRPASTFALKFRVTGPWFAMFNAHRSKLRDTPPSSTRSMTHCWPGPETDVPSLTRFCVAVTVSCVFAAFVLATHSALMMPLLANPLTSGIRRRRCP
jgi:hypothetical protein